MADASASWEARTDEDKSNLKLSWHLKLRRDCGHGEVAGHRAGHRVEERVFPQQNNNPKTHSTLRIRAEASCGGTAQR